MPSRRDAVTVSRSYGALVGPHGGGSPSPASRGRANILPPPLLPPGVRTPGLGPPGPPRCARFAREEHQWQERCRKNTPPETFFQKKEKGRRSGGRKEGVSTCVFVRWWLSGKSSVSGLPSGNECMELGSSTQVLLFHDA